MPLWKNRVAIGSLLGMVCGMWDVCDITKSRG